MINIYVQEGAPGAAVATAKEEQEQASAVLAL